MCVFCVEVNIFIIVQVAGECVQASMAGLVRLPGPLLHHLHSLSLWPQCRQPQVQYSTGSMVIFKNKFTNVLCTRPNFCQEVVELI